MFGMTVATRRERTGPLLSLASSGILVGIFLFPIDQVGETLVGLPLAEFILVALLMWSPRERFLLGARDRTRAMWNPLWFFVALVTFLAVASDALNGFGPAQISKDGMRLFLLFAPPLLIVGSGRRDWFLGVAVGYLLADSLSASLATVSALSTGGDPGLLKVILPMPEILIVFALTLRRQVSVPLLGALMASVTAVVGIAILSGSRNAFVSVAIVGGALILGHLSPRANRGAALFGGAMPWFPILLVWTLPVLEFLHRADIATASNLERSVAMLVSRSLIEQSPWTGTGLAAFSSALTKEMQAIAGLSAPALDPHNFYMQVGVAFGIPAMLIVSITIVKMYHWGYAISTLVPWQRSACLLLLGWTAAITPLSGPSRLEWVMLWFVLLSLAGEATSPHDRFLTRWSASRRGLPFPTPRSLTPLPVPTGRTRRYDKSVSTPRRP